jgi:phenylalanyl-tRNA synthetase beta chain
MKVPLLWLNDYVRPELPLVNIVDRLDLTGTEVERVSRHGVGSDDGFVVGRVLEVSDHPKADRLRVCSVDVGDGEPRQIVCGAPNVEAGQMVAVARPGAVMPDGTTLKAAKLRGVSSDGMILAEDELGLGTDHSGILVLDDGHEPGTPLAEVLPIATDVLELEITPNRPDCLGIYGVAREVAAATGTQLDPPPWVIDLGTEGPVEGARVTVEVPDLCPRFTARVFEDVAIAPSPLWLKARLMAAGQRPINNVVDITNFVMLLTGQPLHAFDLDKVAGRHLIIRQARAGERVTTLDDVDRELDPEMVVVCDEDGPNSIAGIMGGARSEVSEDTTRVLLEVATWNGPNIHATSQRLGLRSEASSRFEKQLAPEQVMHAQAVAAYLMAEVCGARLAGGTIDVGGPPDPPPSIRVRDAKVSALLGVDVDPDRSAEILRALDFKVEVADDGLDVTPPGPRRYDVTREADVIEEIARLTVLEDLPATLPQRSIGGGLTREQRLRRKAEDLLTGRGLNEIVGWSFASPDLPDRLRLSEDDVRRSGVVLANPMSEDQSQLRTTLLGSLLDAVHHNIAHGRNDVRVFEVGTVYRHGEERLPDERRHIGALLAGPSAPPTWRSPDPRTADVFAAKGVLAALLDGLGAAWSVETERGPTGALLNATDPFLHPGRAARVLVGGEPIGWLGELHPAVAETWEIPGAAGFEIDLDAAIAAVPEVVEFRDLVSFPAVRQDLAIVVAEDVPAARVIEVVRAAGGKTLESTEVFDVYRGVQVGEGRVSLALALQFRAPDRTLTDAEVARTREKIERALSTELGATLRS